MTSLLGMLTGIGDGMLRDVLVVRIPNVLRAGLYALAALAGAAVVVIGHLLRLQFVIITLTGGLLCFALRVMAFHYGWYLPSARLPGE